MRVYPLYVSIKFKFYFFLEWTYMAIISLYALKQTAHSSESSSQALWRGLAMLQRIITALKDFYPTPNFARKS
jgi:hypothetical protein